MKPLSRRTDAAAIVVPPTGFTSQLTLLTSAAMAVLCVFALALALAAQKLAKDWDLSLADSATIRIAAPGETRSAQRDAVMEVLSTTPGIASVREITIEEQQKLLAPWLGENAPIDILNLPVLIAITQSSDPYDATGLRLRLAAEAPAAQLDNHNRWREPVVAAAKNLRAMGWGAILLIGAAMAAMVTLATSAALAANTQIIEVLRLIGATDGYIARAFVRRFTLRASLGATAGTVAAALAILLLPQTAPALGVSNLGLGLNGWIFVALVPLAAALVAWVSTQLAASSKLKGLL